MKSALLDLDESAEGIQEGKEWLALMEYFRRWMISIPIIFLI